MKRNYDPAGHGRGTLAGKLQQRGQRNGRWWTPDSRVPVRSGGYNIEQVIRWLDRIASLRERGFAPARFTPTDGFTRWFRGYDLEVIDRYLAGLAGESAAASWN